MLSVLPLLTLLTAFLAQTPEVLQITTVEGGSIVVYTGEDGQYATTIGNKTLTVCLSEGDRVAVDDLGSGGVSGQIDADQVTFEGDLDIRVQPAGKPGSRIRVTDGRVVAGPARTTALSESVCDR